MSDDVEAMVRIAVLKERVRRAKRLALEKQAAFAGEEARLQRAQRARANLKVEAPSMNLERLIAICREATEAE